MLYQAPHWFLTHKFQKVVGSQSKSENCRSCVGFCFPGAHKLPARLCCCSTGWEKERCEEIPHLKTVLVLPPLEGCELWGIFKQLGKACNYVQERQEIPNRSKTF